MDAIELGRNTRARAVIGVVDRTHQNLRSPKRTVGAQARKLADASLRVRWIWSTRKNPQAILYSSYPRAMVARTTRTRSTRSSRFHYLQCIWEKGTQPTASESGIFGRVYVISLTVSRRSDVNFKWGEILVESHTRTKTSSSRPNDASAISEKKNFTWSTYRDRKNLDYVSCPAYKSAFPRISHQRCKICSRRERTRVSFKLWDYLSTLNSDLMAVTGSRFKKWSEKENIYIFPRYMEDYRYSLT